MTYSIAQSRQALEHALTDYERNFGEHKTIIAAARAGILRLAWLERRAELLRALDRLERERPDLADLFEAFPGAQIADVRGMLHNDT